MKNMRQLFNRYCPTKMGLALIIVGAFLIFGANQSGNGIYYAFGVITLVMAVLDYCFETLSFGSKSR